MPLLGRFIADFLAPAGRLVIEVDGGHHAEQARVDAHRGAGAGSRGYLLELDTRPWLHQLRAPSLVICGTADPILPIRHALALQAAIPAAQFLAVEGAGHVPVTEERAEVESAVRALLARI